jgi:hypothetical protein
MLGGIEAVGVIARRAAVTTEELTCVTVVLQWCYSGVTVVLQWCYSGVTMVLEWCYSGVTMVLQWCYNGLCSPPSQHIRQNPSFG